MSFSILVSVLGVCPLALFNIRHHVMGDAISIFSCNLFASFLFWSKFLQLTFSCIQLNMSLLVNWSVVQPHVQESQTTIW